MFVFKRRHQRMISGWSVNTGWAALATLSKNEMGEPGFLVFAVI